MLHWLAVFRFSGFAFEGSSGGESGIAASTLTQLACGRPYISSRAQFRSEARMFEHGMIYRASRRLADIKTLANMRGFIAPVEAAEGSFALLGLAYELHGCDGDVFGSVRAA